MRKSLIKVFVLFALLGFLSVMGGVQLGHYIQGQKTYPQSCASFDKQVCGSVME